MRPSEILFLSDARGIYIPRDFAESIMPEYLSGVPSEDLEILKSGPDHDVYWEVWDDVCNNAVITDKDGNKFRIYQDGDCWLIPEGMSQSDSGEWIWPEDDSSED
jgi:hypothetical protein